MSESACVSILFLIIISGAYSVFFGNILPESVIIFFVTQDGFNGTRKTNPFQFFTPSLVEASLVVNSFNGMY